MINIECVKAYLERHEGAVGLLDLEERINRELRALVAPACEGFTLAAYAHLRPSDAEVRRALLTLLEAVGEDGRLTLKNVAKLRGKFPRDFELMPGERFMVVGHKMSDEIQVYRFDRAACTLEPVGDPIAAWRPLCFKFAAD